MSKYPYIRESRRIRGQGRVTEQDLEETIGPAASRAALVRRFGRHRLLHGRHPSMRSQRARPHDDAEALSDSHVHCSPRLHNFLPAGKNIGVTHLTNGAFRLHPIEWNVGEAAAVIASLSLKKQTAGHGSGSPSGTVYAGVPLVWFDDLKADHPAFAAIHLAAIKGLYPVDTRTLHASPESPVTREEAANILVAFMGQSVGAQSAIDLAVKEGWMAEITEIGSILPCHFIGRIGAKSGFQTTAAIPDEAYRACDPG